MGLFDNFPYTNFHELNLDWILKVLKDIENTIDEFVSLNIIKYADPIQWDIVRQYPKNTIVIDPVSGTAYISVDNVPQGVPLSNTDYWSVVFDLGRFVTLASQNFALSYEPVLTTTATVPTVDGGWVVWNSILYEALNDIHIGDMYVENGNIKKTPVEEFFNRLKAEITTNANNIAQEILDRQAADTALGGRIDQEILDRHAADTALGGRIDQEILDRQSAISAINTRIDDLLEGEAYVNVKRFGAVGNAQYYQLSTRSYWADSNCTIQPHNDVDAINAAINYALDNNINIVYFPTGYYYLPNWTYDLDITKLRFVGSGETALVSSGLQTGNFITISSPLSLNMYNTAKCPLENISLWGCYGVGSGSTVNGLAINTATRVVACHCSFKNVVVKDFNYGLYGLQGYKTIWYNFSAIACRYGIWLDPNCAIPMYFIGGFVECCGIGLMHNGNDWSNLVFESTAFEYNMQQISVNYGAVFNNCRFENDPRCEMSSYNYTVSGKYCFFNNCDFMLLPNYEGNVSNWIYNPSQYIVRDTITFAQFAGTDIHLTNCRVGLGDIPLGSGFYIFAFTYVYAINTRAENIPAAKLIDTSTYQTIHDTMIY